MIEWFPALFRTVSHPDPSYAWHQWLHFHGKRDKVAVGRIARMLDAIPRHVRLHDGDRVLSIGPRNEVEVRALMHAVPGPVDAIDLNAGSPLIRRGDMHTLPYADDTYGLVAASHVLEHALNLSRAADEIARVVRPGGYVWIAVPRDHAPDPHDRWRFRDRRDVLVRFASHTPEILHDASTPSQIALLIRLWKDGTAGPRVLVPMTDRPHVRMLVTSGMVAMLRDDGYRVTALVPGSLVDAVAVDLPGVIVEAVEPYLAPRWRAVIRRHILRTLSYVRRARTKTTYQAKLARRTILRHRLLVAICRLVDRATDGELLALRIEGWLPVSRRARALISAEKPDVVLVPSSVYAGDEAEIEKAAHRAGVPVLLQLLSWDTATSKGLPLVAPTAVLTWGRAAERQVIKEYGYDPERVHPVGPPHFDLYATCPSDWPELKVEADRPLILVAGSTVAYWQEELATVAALGAALDPLATVWYRPHPRTRREVGERALGLPNVTLDPWWHRTAGQGFSLDREVLASTRAILDKSVCVVTSFSTLCIEAALMGVSSFLVGFGTSAWAGGSLMQHADFAHMKAVADWPGVTVCSSMETLVGRVRLECESRRWGRNRVTEDAMRRLGDEVARCADGGARRRVVVAVEHYAARP